MSSKYSLFSVFAALVSLGFLVPAQQTLAQDAPAISRGDVERTTAVELTELVTGLQNPGGMAWLPDGTILVTERAGALRVVRDEELLEASVAGTPEVFASGQGGLMDVIAHPEFEENSLVYLTYAHGNEESNRTRVARAVFDGNALSDMEVIFEVSQAKPGAQHFGSRLLWLPDGTLLVSIGDGGNPPVELNGELIRLRAQDVSSHIGKIVRINADGSVPDDNPFVDTDGAAPAVWSYGHRNIQGLAIDPATQQVWANEHGALHGDELNAVQAGGNYGWPLATFSRDYRGATEISPHTSLPDMIDPTVVWMDTQAPSGLVIYSGARFPDWRGHLFSGGLVSQEIRHIEVDANGRMVEERFIPIGERVRDVREGPDGLLYVLTDEDDGRLLWLDPSG